MPPIRDSAVSILETGVTTVEEVEGIDRVDFLRASSSWLSRSLIRAPKASMSGFGGAAVVVVLVVS